MSLKEMTIKWFQIQTVQRQLSHLNSTTENLPHTFKLKTHFFGSACSVNIFFPHNF